MPIQQRIKTEKIQKIRTISPLQRKLWSLVFKAMWTQYVLFPLYDVQCGMQVKTPYSFGFFPQLKQRVLLLIICCIIPWLLYKKQSSSQWVDIISASQLRNTRNTRFAVFLGALRSLCAFSATGVWAAPKLNIWNKTLIYVKKNYISSSSSQ